MNRVGFVGLGNIGKPMALRIAARGLPLSVYDVASDPVTELVAAGASGAGSIAELTAASDVVCVMVRDDDQVRAVLDEILAASRLGQVVAVHSTVAPDTPAELEATATAKGVLVVDAPVSGGAMGAADGTLAIMAGGSAEAFAAAKETLDALGTLVVHAGPIGSGTAMKLARNLIHFVAFAAVTESQRLAEAAGLDLVKLGEVVRHTDAITGGPGAIMHRPTTATMAADDFWRPIFGHVAALGDKDLDFAAELAERLRVDVPLNRLARERLAPGLGL